MSEESEKFDLNLSDEHKAFILSRGHNTILESNVEAAESYLKKEKSIPDSLICEMLEDLEYEPYPAYVEIRDLISCWPPEDESDDSWTPINNYIVAMKSYIEWPTSFADNVPGEEPHLYTLYLVDRNRKVHTCSLCGKYELWELGSIIITEPIGWDLEHHQIGKVNEMEDCMRYSSCERITYTNANLFSGGSVVCQHLGAPKQPVFTYKNDPDEEYVEYMDNLVNVLVAEGAVLQDCDIRDSIRDTLDLELYSERS